MPYLLESAITTPDTGNNTIMRYKAWWVAFANFFSQAFMVLISAGAGCVILQKILNTIRPKIVMPIDLCKLK